MVLFKFTDIKNIHGVSREDEGRNIVAGSPQVDDAFARMKTLTKAHSPGCSEDLPPTCQEETVVVYRNGLTVNDGPFRPLSDPANQQILDDMAAGMAPAELREGCDNLVHVAVCDRRGEDYTAPAAPCLQAFSGEGHSLGGGSAAVAGPMQADEGAIKVDPSKPQTRIKIRFRDGQHKVQDFMEDHTVGDLRRHVQHYVGGVPMAIFFGSSALTDDSITIKAAGLSCALVSVRPV